MSETTKYDAETLRKMSASMEWYHSISLAPGVVTQGRQPLAAWEDALARLGLPDLRGKSVLDIGAFDGFFCFAAERLGAARVVALDHYVWSADMRGYMTDWRASRKSGTDIPPPHESRYWDPERLPGQAPFNLAREALGSRVESVVGDFMTMDLASVGRFDVVLFLGVLYHLEEPLTAMRRVRQLVNPDGLVVVETEAMEIPGSGGRPLCEFFPGRELNNDPTNWWVPNGAALTGLCRGAGFRDATVVSRTVPPYHPWSLRLSAALRHLWYASGLPRRIGSAAPEPDMPVLRHRAVAHARA